MCDVPSIAVFCSESIECFPGTASKFLLKLLVTIPVAPIIIGIIVLFRFHIRCISIHKLLYFNFFSASFCTTFLSALLLLLLLLLLLQSRHHHHHRRRHLVWIGLLFIEFQSSRQHSAENLQGMVYGLN